MESVIGYERHFDPEDIFFSTTDRRGVITRSNRTFDVLSRYDREKLIGAPHNIIRHADMPAAVFKCMWDDLASGLPVCAYVTNRAADHLDYRVFATVVPLHDGYLSVRLKPLQSDTQHAVEDAYRRVRTLERQHEAAGMPKREVAIKGAEALGQELSSLGFPSMYAMTSVALPAEVESLINAGVRVPARPQASGGVAEVLDAVNEIERETNLLVFRLDEYERLLNSLTSRSQQVEPVAERADAVVAAVAAGWAPGEKPKVEEFGERVTNHATSAAAVLRTLPGRMVGLHKAVTDLRFRIALVRLETLMVGRFAASILDGGEADAIGAINDLCEAMESSVHGLVPALRKVTLGVDDMSSSLQGAVGDLDRVLRPLMRWVDARKASNPTRAVAPALERANVLAEQGFPEVRPLAELAAQCRGLDLPFDQPAVDNQLHRIRQALTTLN